MKLMKTWHATLSIKTFYQLMGRNFPFPKGKREQVGHEGSCQITTENRTKSLISLPHPVKNFGKKLRIFFWATEIAKVVVF